MQKIFVKNMQFFYRDFSAELTDLHEIGAGLEWIWFAGNNIYRPVNKCQPHVANGLWHRLKRLITVIDGIIKPALIGKVYSGPAIRTLRTRIDKVYPSCYKDEPVINSNACPRRFW